MTAQAQGISYRLFVWVPSARAIVVGALGPRLFARGLYVYTGSARRAMGARLLRYLQSERTMRWHIDYLLGSQGVQVVDLTVHTVAECRLNQQGPGCPAVTGFGASDCRAGCGAHLKYLGDRPWCEWLAYD